MGIWQLNRKLLYFKVWGREFPLHSQIIEMPIFLEYGVFKMLCYYNVITNLLLRIVPKCPEMCSCSLLEGLPCLLIPFCLKIFFLQWMWFAEASRLLFLCAGGVTLNWSGKKEKKKEKGREHKSCFHSCPLCSSYCPLSPQRLLQKLSWSFPPPPHFYLMPGDVQSSTCAENLALGHVYEGQQAQAAF